MQIRARRLRLRESGTAIQFARRVFGYASADSEISKRPSTRRPEAALGRSGGARTAGEFCKDGVPNFSCGFLQPALHGREEIPAAVRLHAVVKFNGYAADLVEPRLTRVPEDRFLAAFDVDLNRDLALLGFAILGQQR